MESKISTYCPECFSEELKMTHTEDSVVCMKCNLILELEDLIRKETFKLNKDQPDFVPYKYHQLNRRLI